jgi:hypothetical protein
LKFAVNENNTERVYDLADALHDLPILLVANNFSIPACYWKQHIKYYRKKWNENFLKKEQKSMKRNIIHFAFA